MSHEEDEDKGEDDSHCHMCGPMKKDFKLAMLDKKEKILKAKLEFIGKMKAMMEKMSDEK
jgi:hypothetical protein